MATKDEKEAKEYFFIYVDEVLTFESLCFDAMIAVICRYKQGDFKKLLITNKKIEHSLHPSATNVSHNEDDDESNINKKQKIDLNDKDIEAKVLDSIIYDNYPSEADIDFESFKKYYNRLFMNNINRSWSIDLYEKHWELVINISLQKMDSKRKILVEQSCKTHKCNKSFQGLKSHNFIVTYKDEPLFGFILSEKGIERCGLEELNKII